MWSKKQASALTSIFVELNNSNIEWMVLRNYEGLPENNRSKDIDLLVAKKNFPLVRDILINLLSKNEFTHIKKDLFQYAWCYTFISVNSTGSCSIKIDLLDGFVWRGAQIASFKSLYKKRVNYKDFYVPDPISDGFMLWVKPLMTGGIVKEKYIEDILQVISEYPEEFFLLLTKVFGKSLACKVWPLLKAGKLGSTVTYKKRLCHIAWFKALFSCPFKTIVATTEHYYKEIIRRSQRPRASIIAVVGPDGVGKSTFIEFLQNNLAELLVKDASELVVQHFRPNIFPNIKKLFSDKTYDEMEEDFTSPHRAKPAGTLSSLLRLCYYYSDYVLGYWLHVRNRCVTGKVYIFDRYFYDFLVDPHRSRINLPRYVRLFFLKMTPEPDMVFFLNCGAETVYSRKQELSLDEIKRQLKEYRSLARKSRRFIVLDAYRKPEELCVDAISEFFMRSFPRI